MTAFWMAVGLFLAGTLVLLLPALWARPSAAGGAGARMSGTSARTALASGTSARTALALAVLIPLGSVALYLQVGSPGAVAPRAVHGSGDGARGEDLQAQIQQRVASLAQRLRANPADAQGWLMLGRSYTVLGRYRDAAEAHRRAAELLPPQAALLADLADLTAMAQGKRFAGEPARLIQRALDLDPRHVKALALAGSVVFEARDYAAARGYWERAIAELPADAPMAQSLGRSVTEARRLELAASDGAAGAASRQPARPSGPLAPLAMPNAAGAAPAQVGARRP